MYRRLGRHVRRWSSSAKSTRNDSFHSSAPSTLRVTKTYGADKHEAELDSTLARLIGSDWGDRSRQPVSLPMRLYWIVFTVVLGNGLYTYFTGKDELFLVEKFTRKADEKMGIQEEEKEFRTIADGCKKDNSNGEVAIVKPNEKNVSMLQSSVSGLPFIVPSMSLQITGTTAKADCTGDGALKDEVELSMRMIDIQKEQIKLQLKRL
ncbi:unnamed protein product [Peronospora destructor]|uniref:Uncharacterized protein n=1 Tax=Peronospora destructor TaxID=86335 RepID=A0AAV0VCU1_9STRA|nr:unnamed protein product [Peronospora destructor]